MSDKQNLLEETLHCLKRHGKDPLVDVLWVGSADGKYSISWQDFERITKDLVYDSGYGGQEIANDLVVVGDDWWLNRHEYDGSECWNFETRPTQQPNGKPFLYVKDPDGGSWNNVEACNAEVGPLELLADTETP